MLKKSAVVAGAAMSVGVFGVPGLLAQRSPNSKLGMALIGANSRGEAHYNACASERLVALVDIDDHNRYGAVKWLEDRKLPKARSSAISARCTRRWTRRLTPSSSPSPTIATPPHR